MIAKFKKPIASFLLASFCLFLFSPSLGARAMAPSGFKLDQFKVKNEAPVISTEPVSVEVNESKTDVKPSVPKAINRTNNKTESFLRKNTDSQPAQPVVEESKPQNKTKQALVDTFRRITNKGVNSVKSVNSNTSQSSRPTPTPTPPPNNPKVTRSDRDGFEFERKNSADSGNPKAIGAILPTVGGVGDLGLPYGLLMPIVTNRDDFLMTADLSNAWQEVFISHHFLATGEEILDYQIGLVDTAGYDYYDSIADVRNKVADGSEITVYTPEGEESGKVKVDLDKQVFYVIIDEFANGRNTPPIEDAGNWSQITTGSGISYFQLVSLGEDKFALVVRPTDINGRIDHQIEFNESWRKGEKESNEEEVYSVAKLEFSIMIDGALMALEHLAYYRREKIQAPDDYDSCFSLVVVSSTMAH